MDRLNCPLSQSSGPPACLHSPQKSIGLTRLPKLEKKAPQAKTRWTLPGLFKASARRCSPEGSTRQALSPHKSDWRFMHPSSCGTRRLWRSIRLTSPAVARIESMIRQSTLLRPTRDIDRWMPLGDRMKDRLHSRPSLDCLFACRSLCRQAEDRRLPV
jgi:hypothetical protein